LKPTLFTNLPPKHLKSIPPFQVDMGLAFTTNDSTIILALRKRGFPTWSQ